MAKFGKVLATMVLVFTMAGCQAMTGKTAGRNVDDATITTSVKTKLAADKVSSSHGLTWIRTTAWFRSMG